MTSHLTLATYQSVRSPPSATDTLDFPEEEVAQNARSLPTSCCAVLLLRPLILPPPPPRPRPRPGEGGGGQFSVSVFPNYCGTASVWVIVSLQGNN